jgi:hypothetical protein
VGAEGGQELYTVSIRGEGIAVEKSVPAQIARQVMLVVMGGAVTGDASAPINRVDPVGVAESGLRRISLREFLDEAQARRNPDKITAIAEYLFQFEEMGLFTREEIKGRFRAAGEAAPANFPRDFAASVKNGWIAEDSKAPGSFYVTQKGRNAIENKFSSEVKKTTARPVGRRRARRSTREPDSLR